MEKIKDYLFLHLCVALFSFTSVFSKLRVDPVQPRRSCESSSVCMCVSDVFCMFCICDLLAEDHQAL